MAHIDLFTMQVVALLFEQYSVMEYMEMTLVVLLVVNTNSFANRVETVSSVVHAKEQTLALVKFLTHRFKDFQQKRRLTA